MAEVASAYVTLIPSARGFGREVEGQIGGEVQQSGKSLGGKLMKGLKVTGVAAAAGIGGLLAASLTKGWGRLTSIENAEAKLKGLGNSSKSVAKIMDNALASVKGTAFGMDEAATTAASVVAAGIKPGKQLESVLKTVADTATIAGISMGDMGTIFGSVAARGKLQGDDLMQLQSRGVPVLAFLAKHYGVTAQAASKMVSKGQVDFKNFSAAMKENLGGAALDSGKTTQGAFKNMGAALSRFGAGLLKGVFPLAKKVFGGLTTFIDNASKAVQPFVEKFSGKLGDVFSKLGGLFSKNAPAIKSFASSLLEMGKSIAGSVIQAVKDLAATFGPMVKEFGGAALKAAPGVFAKLGDAVKTVGSVLTAVTGFMREHATLVQTLVVVVGAGVVAWKAWTLGIKAWSAVTKIATAVQAAFSAVMSANPIMLVVIAIAALAAGLVYAYKHSETFRNIVNAAFDGVKAAGQALWDVLKAAFGGIKGAFKAVGDAANFMWDKVLRPAFKFVADAWLTVVGVLVHGAATAFGWVPGVGPKLKSAAREFDKLRDRVDASLSGIGKEAEGFGSDWARGLARGISANAHVPIATAQGVANKIAAASRAAVDSHSPSRVAASIGEDFNAGWALGLKASAAEPERAARASALRVADTIRAVPAPVVSRGALAVASRTDGGAAAPAFALPLKQLDYLINGISNGVGGAIVGRGAQVQNATRNRPR